MNSHERRVVGRRWPHCITVDCASDDHSNEIFDWLYTNFGSCWFNRKHNPRWVFRPYQESIGSFAMVTTGVQIFFRKEKDYAWFMMRWG